MSRRMAGAQLLGKARTGYRLTHHGVTIGSTDELLQSEAIGGGISGARLEPVSPESGTECQPTVLIWPSTMAGAGNTNVTQDT